MKRLTPIFFALLLAGGLRPAAAQDTNAPVAQTNASADFSAFQAIAQKNIFDPNRTGSSGSRRRARRVESFAFCGGGFDGPEAVAFFSGTGAGNKPLKPGEAINGYKVAAITFQTVDLTGPDGAPLTLRVGGSLRREEGGPWKASSQPAPASDASSGSSADTASAAPAASSANDSEIIRRLKAKREEEDK